MPHLLQRFCYILFVIAAATLAWSCSSGSSPGGSSQSGDPDAPADTDTSCPTTVDYAGFAEPLFNERCNGCHGSGVTGASRSGAPVDVVFESEADFVLHADRIRVRVIDERTMPPGDPLSDCDAQRLGAYLDSLGGSPCTPNCDGRACGDDGCGGTCGTCASGERCDAASGQCEMAACVPECSGIACGGDGCGGSCGTCGSGLTCDGGSCVCSAQCDGRACGDDGCGGQCGTCSDGSVCAADGTCRCIPDCTAAVCGDDGCGGSCGTCPVGDTCTGAQDGCECVPDCSGRQCGPDGCGGSCGTCPGALVCNTRSGSCQSSCTPDCSGRVCGDDGCGGSCGGCGDSEYCDAAGQCQCAPACLGKACGPDGCGGDCGTCADGAACSATGQCECVPDCTGRECGGDGCGGSCGAGCPDGQSCTGDGQCTTVCVPDCGTNDCGADGCGGSCGACGSGQTCDGGQCVYPSLGFAADVYPIFETSSCADRACHSGVRPAEDLPLTSASVAYDALVGSSSGQCSGRLLVAPGDPNASYLIDKLTGVDMCSGTVMPKGDSPLSAAEIDTIRAWIGGGASP